MAGEKSKSPFECLNDVAAEKDILGFKPYVEAIAEFLTAEGTKPPITLSIEGQWGCGKSSFMKQLKDRIRELNDLETDNLGTIEANGHIDIETNSEITGSGFWESLFPKKKYFAVWFNCWRYEKEDELWAAFALHFMEQLSEQLSWERRLWAQLKLRLLRLEFKWKSKNSIFTHIVLFIFAVWFFIDYSIPKFMVFLSSYSIDGSSGSLLITLTKIIAPILPILYVGKDIKDVVGNPFNFSKFVSNPNYKEHISFIEHFHSDFGKIIESYAGSSRVYVFVDDLDRCEVPKAAELMQALNLMISDDTNVYFSIGMDRKVISAGLVAKNEKVIGYLDVEGLEYGDDYIEKFIQLPFKVPSPKSVDFLKFLTSFDESESPSKSSEPVDKSGISEDSAPDKSPEGDVESSLNKNNEQETGTDDSNNVVTESNKQEIRNYKDCVEDFETSKIILEMVAPALDNNPRRIKQFINQFRFQRTIGYNTGLFCYGEDTDPENMWNCKKLAKFVAISIQWNLLISALVSNSKLLDQLQEYALKLGNEDNENEYLKKWTKDEKLIGLLKYGCVEEGNLSEEKANYTLSGLDFSKLLQISPVVAPPEGGTFGLSPITVDGIEFIPIPAEDFMMGSNEYDDEKPVHNVNIENPFYLGKYPVTQEQWEKVMGSNPSHFKGNNLPVDSVSWDDVQEFINKLNKGTDNYRLPSEAEWEYACRARTNTKYSFGDDESKLGDYAWYSGYATSEEWNQNIDKIRKEGSTHPVGQKKPNPWGLYDMHGNVWEWVQDKYHGNYEGAPPDGSAWEDGDSSKRVLRGGSWFSDARHCRSASRSGLDPDDRVYYVGFRLLRKP